MVLHQSFARHYAATRVSMSGSGIGEVEPLTPRETDVLQMLAEGLPNKSIAYNLGISEHTVKFHISSIFSKMGVSSRTEAVTSAARLGLILL
jgi:DNA-binding NarL/FixJ family response regulator